jgi:hypothetical protein
MISSEEVDEVLNIVRKFQSNESETEVEIRYGRFENNNFVSNVPRRVFFTLIEEMKRRKLHPKISESTDQKQDNIRRTQFKNGTIKWIEKKKLLTKDFNQYSSRLSINSETSIQSPSTQFRPSSIRRKKRRSYTLTQEGIRIDLTEVRDERDRLKFEVEFELLKLDNIESVLSDIFSFSFKLVNSTFDIYTLELKSSIISYINQSIQSKTGGNTFFDISNISRPRNLKFKDLVYGGIVGNPSVTYNVTHKTDGVRKQLLVHNTGIWIFSFNGDFNFISKDSLFKYMQNQLNHTSNNLFGMCGYILDGELIPVEKRIKGSGSGAEYWFLIFDCLSVPRNTDVKSFDEVGNRNIQDEPFITRMENSQVVADSIKNPIIEISTKNFNALTTPSVFFDVLNRMFQEQKDLPYKQDGFIFTPIEIGYSEILNSFNQPMELRTLVNLPDIVKWKTKYNLTIDFEIEWNQERLTLFSLGRDNKKIVFNGDEINRFNPIQDIEMTSRLRETTSGTIGEFEYDFDRKKLLLRNLRPDKAKPNTIEVAKDVWVDIHNPIEEDVMIGQSMNLLRKYHNRIKTALFSTVSRDKPNLTLLDIGSGNGGDISKWRNSNFSRIVAVEPDTINYNELLRRIEQFSMTDKILPVNTTGQNSKLITRRVKEFIGTRVDVISMMLSLSYFFENQSSLNDLLKTITENIASTGVIIFLTIDGNIVQNYFQPQLSNSISLKEISSDYFRMKYNDDTNPISVDVFIKNSILNNREWLVKLDDLMIPLNEFGFILNPIFRSDKEKMMSQTELLFGGMFSYGIIQPEDEVKLSVLRNQERRNFNSRTIPVDLKIDPKNMTIPFIPEINIKTIPNINEVIPFKYIELNEEKQSQKNINQRINLKNQNRRRVEVDGIKSKSKEFINQDVGKINPKNFTQIRTIYVQLFPFKDDITQSLNINFKNQQLNRVSSINDNSSLVHCMMKALKNEEYLSSGLSERKKIVREFRRDLAFLLNEQVDGSKLTYYETIYNGLFSSLYLKDSNEFSLSSLQKKLNSNNQIEEEILFIISHFIELNFIICRLFQRIGKVKNEQVIIQLQYLTSTILKSSRDFPVVVLLQSQDKFGDHYELIQYDGQVIFDFKDDLIQELIEKKLLNRIE